MGAFARAMDRLAEWVRWLAEAVRLLKPRQNPQNAQGVLEAFLSDVPVAERTEDELRADGVPVDDIKDTEEREHGLGSETVGAPAEEGETVVGEEGAGPEGVVRADSEPIGADVGGDVGSGDVGRGAEPAQGVKREETREERLERRKRQRREANEIRERLNRLMKKNRKYGGRRHSIEVTGDILRNGALVEWPELRKEILDGKVENGRVLVVNMDEYNKKMNVPFEECLFVTKDGVTGLLVSTMADKDKDWEHRGLSTSATLVTDDYEVNLVLNTPIEIRNGQVVPMRKLDSKKYVTDLTVSVKMEDSEGVRDYDQAKLKVAYGTGWADFAVGRTGIAQIDRLIDGFMFARAEAAMSRSMNEFITGAQGYYAQRFSTERVDDKINVSLEGVTREGFVGRLGETLDERIKSGRIVAGDSDRERIREGAERFFDEFSRKKILLSDGRYVYFAPTSVVGSRTEIEDNVDAWVEYAIHAVTNDVARKDGTHARKYNAAKVAALEDVERIIRKESVLDEDNQRPDTFVFVGISGDNRLSVVTRLDEVGNINADLTEVTTIVTNAKRKSPPTIPLSAAVAKRVQGAGYPLATEDTIAQNRPGVKFSTEKPGDEGLSSTVRSVREALRRDGDKAVELLGGTILSNYVREETNAALRKRVARAAMERLFNVVPVSEERLRQAGLIEETLALPEDEDEVASEYEDAKIVDARNRREHGGVLVGESQAEAVVRARAKQVLGKTFRYLFEVYHGTPHAGWTRWERGHGGTTGLGYAYFAPRVITAAEYADTYGAPNDGLTDVKDMQRYGISEAVYHMVVGMNNPLIVDCRRASWNNIRMKNKRTVRTDEILNVARFGELGYDGVIFLNVHDSQLSVKLHGYDVDVVPLGPVMKSGKNGDVAKQMKSLDGVTVSDVDVPEFFGAIDIRDRFDVRDPDIRWSTEKPGDAARPSFSATAEGRRVVAGILDNLMRFQEDLAFSNPAVEQQRADYGNAAVGKWNQKRRGKRTTKSPGAGREAAPGKCTFILCCPKEPLWVSKRQYISKD